MNMFFRSYFCRAEPFPPKELLPALKNMSEDKTVRGTVLVYSIVIIKSMSQVSNIIIMVLSITPSFANSSLELDHHL